MPGNMHASKSSVEYYRELLRELKADAKDCLMIGDSFRKDGLAAQIGIPVFILSKKFRVLSDFFMTGTLEHLNLLLKARAVDGVVVNLQSQSGRALAKWARLNPFFKGKPIFFLESINQELELKKWIETLFPMQIPKLVASRR